MVAVLCAAVDVKEMGVECGWKKNLKFFNNTYIIQIYKVSIVCIF